MDLAVRALREGPVHGLACLAVIEDALASVGGPALFRKIVQDLASSVAQGRARSTTITVAAVSGKSDFYHSLTATTNIIPPQLLNVVYSLDAVGFLPKATSLISLASLEQRIIDSITTSLAKSAPHPQGGGGQAPSTCLIIDDVSALVERFGAAAIADFLLRLRRRQDVSSLLCYLHADLHTSEQAALVRHNATCLISVKPPGDLGALLDAIEWNPHGRVQVIHRRKNGRAGSESKLYRVTSNGLAFRDLTAAAALASTPATTALPGAKDTMASSSSSLLPKATGSFPSSELGALVQQVAGGMNLGLTEEEKAARGNVQLPYEHQGQVGRYATNDFRDYLPPAAGGHGGSGAVGGRLGHILYVRDSDSEEGDSDEDPDDDLDI